MRRAIQGSLSQRAITCWEAGEDHSLLLIVRNLRSQGTRCVLRDGRSSAWAQIRGHCPPSCAQHATCSLRLHPASYTPSFLGGALKFNPSSAQYASVRGSLFSTIAATALGDSGPIAVIICVLHPSIIEVGLTALSA